MNLMLDRVLFSICFCLQSSSVHLVAQCKWRRKVYNRVRQISLIEKRYLKRNKNRNVYFQDLTTSINFCFTLLQSLLRWRVGLRRKVESFQKKARVFSWNSLKNSGQKHDFCPIEINPAFFMAYSGRNIQSLWISAGKKVCLLN